MNSFTMPWPFPPGPIFCIKNLYWVGHALLRRGGPTWNPPSWMLEVAHPSGPFHAHLCLGVFNFTVFQAWRVQLKPSLDQVKLKICQPRRKRVRQLVEIPLSLFAIWILPQDGHGGLSCPPECHGKRPATVSLLICTCSFKLFNGKVISKVVQEQQPYGEPCPGQLRSGTRLLLAQLTNIREIFSNRLWIKISLLFKRPWIWFKAHWFRSDWRFRHIRLLVEKWIVVKIPEMHLECPFKWAVWKWE